MTNKELYSILDLTRDASPEDIKKSFRKLAMQYHPDKNKEDDAEEKFKEVSFAYNILSDPEKKGSTRLQQRTFLRPASRLIAHGTQIHQQALGIPLLFGSALPY